MKKMLLSLLAIILLLSGCKKSIDEQIDEAIAEFVLDGFYQSSYDLQIEIKDGTATVIGFVDPTHELNRNPSLFKIGDPYIKNIRQTGEDEWEGEVVKSNYDIVNDVFTIKGYEKTKITPSGKDGLYISNPNRYERSFKKISKPAGNGNGNGNGNGGNSGGTTETLYEKQVEGKLHEQRIISFNVPAGTKTLTIRTFELDGSDKNSADMFVRAGSQPKITHTYPPATSSYSWVADCSSIKPNRESELCTFSNPKAGTWYVTLYGYNDYFWSRLNISITK